MCNGAIIEWIELFQTVQCVFVASTKTVSKELGIKVPETCTYILNILCFVLGIYL